MMKINKSNYTIIGKRNKMVIYLFSSIGSIALLLTLLMLIQIFQGIKPSSFIKIVWIFFCLMSYFIDYFQHLTYNKIGNIELSPKNISIEIKGNKRLDFQINEIRKIRLHFRSYRRWVTFMALYRENGTGNTIQIVTNNYNSETYEFLLENKLDYFNLKSIILEWVVSNVSVDYYENKIKIYYDNRI